MGLQNSVHHFPLMGENNQYTFEGYKQDAQSKAANS